MQKLLRRAFHHEVQVLGRLQPLHLPVLLLRAQSGATLNMRVGVEGWLRLHRGPLTVVPLPGDHGSVFFRPNLPVIADAMHAWLDGLPELVH